jgi:hypothetical protein
MSKVYLVWADNGDWYDAQDDWIVGVYSTEEKAKERVALIEEWRQENPYRGYTYNERNPEKYCPYDSRLSDQNCTNDYKCGYYEMELDA